MRNLPFPIWGESEAFVDPVKWGTLPFSGLLDRDIHAWIWVKYEIPFYTEWCLQCKRVYDSSVGSALSKESRLAVHPRDNEDFVFDDVCDLPPW